MNILLIVAETPYLNEWFAKLVSDSKSLGLDATFTVYCNSEIARRDKLRLFDPETAVFYYQRWPERMVPSHLSWRHSYISWERQQFQKSFRYDAASIPEIIRDVYWSVMEAVKATKPDVILYELPSSLLGEVVYQVAKDVGSVQYVGVSQSRIPDRIDLYDDKYRFHQDQEVAASDDATWERLNDQFVTKKIVPTYMKDNINKMHRTSVIMHYVTRWDRFKFFVTALPSLSATADYETREAFAMLIRSLLNHLKRRFRQGMTRRWQVEPSPGERYVLFPMHLLPESSVSGQAMWFSHVLTTIRYIAFCLPLSHSLYVREHPGAVGTLPASFYKQLAQIPSVKLVSHELDGTSLIQGAESIITLTSTLGLEAALIGKPVYVLGDVFYDVHESCVSIRDLSALSDRLQTPPSQVETEELRRRNVKFWRWYFSNTIPGNVLTANVEAQELLKALTRILKIA